MNEFLERVLQELTTAFLKEDDEKITLYVPLDDFEIIGLDTMLTIARQTDFIGIDGNRSDLIAALVQNGFVYGGRGDISEYYTKAKTSS